MVAVDGENGQAHIQVGIQVVGLTVRAQEEEADALLGWGNGGQGGWRRGRVFVRIGAMREGQHWKHARQFWARKETGRHVALARTDGRNRLSTSSQAPRHTRLVS
eukprot:365458-Chlamydomonas_euryale.AAC.8